MAEFQTDARDVKFALLDHIGIEKLFDYPRYQDLDRATVEAILDEAYKLARNQMAPMNPIGDKEGALFDPKTGEVKVPEVFHETYKLYTENGWLGFVHNPDFGGQGMPYSLGLAANDFFFGACLSFCLGPLLTTGAAHLIEVFGTDELKKIYLEKMYTGQWSGTMCLTESGAGSDVGAVRARARKEGDHYLIGGEKIFITYGDHDLTENVIHAVLARVEGAPEGTRGISLFLVPKIRVNPDGSLGEPNDVACTGVEHKMGIHASATCTLNFGENGQCRGWLLGEENKGMRAMFQMMNEARIQVGLQGAALANAAYQYALEYAKERVQGKDLLAGKGSPDVTIDHHPDVRQMLMQQKAIGEGTRALLLRTGFYLDLAEVSTDPDEKALYEGLAGLLTPIAKGYSTDQGFKATELAIQTLGGYGYLSEYPVEQYMRDMKIASIYEGTNGIQALDLVGRKLAGRGGADFKNLIGLMMKSVAPYESHPVLGRDIAVLGEAREALVDVTTHFAKNGADNPLMPILNATTYLDLMGSVVMGWLLLEQALIAWPKLEDICKAKGIDPADAKAVRALAEDDPDAQYFLGKIKVAQFNTRRNVALGKAKADIMKSGDQSAMEAVL